MGRKSAEERDSTVIRAIKQLCDNADQSTSLIKTQWREQYDMFVYGTQNDEKEEWQTNFSVNKYQTSIRVAQGRLVNVLVNQPDWFALEPRSMFNQQAELLAPAFTKILEYYLETSKFKRHAGTFFLCSLISSGSMYVGWKPRLVQNPKYTLDKTEEERRKEQSRLAKKVVNPQIEDPLEGDALEEELLAAIEEFTSVAQGLPAKKEAIPPYVQIGCLDLLDINHEKVYWDPNCQYMEESMWRAFELDVNKWELNYAAKLGFYPKAKIAKIGPRKELTARGANQNLRYQNTQPSVTSKSDTVTLRFYYGPLIDPDSGEILRENYWCVIANDSIVLKDGEYPFWEPPGHKTPVITAAVKQIPYRATGAGIGDNAVGLQKLYDSNWQLICDTFRFGIAGINVVNYQSLTDKSQLAEGVHPGMTLEVRGTPKDAFQHIDLTSNVENQAHPVQNMLEQSIDTLTGINELMAGGSNPHSRTAAAETNARLDAGNQNVNIIALDLEANFLVPALEKCFARILQFGMAEINSNPELGALLTEDELHEISQLNAGNRMAILNQWYNFKVKGFSSSQDKNEARMRDNELLQIANSGGPLSQLINLPEFMKQYFKNMDIKNPDILLIQDSPLAQVTAENQVLMAGHSVLPAQEDDHQFHLENQQPLAMSPYATPQIQEHVQLHMQQMQQMQAAQQQQPGAGQQPPPQ